MKKPAVKKTTSSTKQSVTEQFSRLNTWNRVLVLLHAIQGLAILVLSTERTFPLTTSYLTTDTIATQATGNPVLAPATHLLADVNLAYLLAGFFFLSALAHLLMATVYRPRYEAGLRQGINRLRWIEYALSASVMLVAIGFLTGIYDLSTLLLIFALTAVMNLTGLIMEVHNPVTKRTRPNWLSYIVGCIAGAVPWIVLAIYLIGSNVFGDGNIPTFVYWIYGTIFVLFMSFAVNMYLQYARKGKWADCLYGERGYMILSLVAKSTLAWQVFFGALRP